MRPVVLSSGTVGASSKLHFRLDVAAPRLQSGYQALAVIPSVCPTRSLPRVARIPCIGPHTAGVLAAAVAYADVDPQVNQQEEVGGHSGEHVGRVREEEEPPRALEPVAPFTTVDRVPLAGGMLELVVWEPSETPGKTPDRLLRIWTPPGHFKADAGREGWPVLYLNDGQNLYYDNESFSGCSWRAAEAAAALIASGTVPPFIIVGMDNSGANRSLDYTPCKPGSGPQGFRKDAASWAGGGVDAYLEKVVMEVMPFAQRAFGAASSPDLVAFGGSSFGGICTLVAAMRRPGLFGAALVESPSLWIAEERFLHEDVAGFKGEWPQRMFIGMGGREYSGIRPPEEEARELLFDKIVAGYAPALKDIIEGQGVADSRLKVVVDPKATHNEAAWAARLPEALSFLLAPWWAALAARHPHDLYFTVPRRLRAGQPAALAFNTARSASLAGQARVSLCLGFNGWSEKVEAAMQPMQGAASGSSPASSSTWHLAQFRLPENAYEMNFAFSNQEGSVWDSNNGSNFYARVALINSETARTIKHHFQNLPGKHDANQAVSVDELAHANKYHLYFTYPEKLTPGQPAMLYMNRRQSDVFRECPNIKLQYCWNNWEHGCTMEDLKPTTLWRSDEQDWWGVQITPPETAAELHFCFTDGHGNWDSNFGENYSQGVVAAAKANGAGHPTLARPRGIQHEERLDHADGHLHVLTLSKRTSGDKTSDRNSKWTEEKVVRVWTPRGYSRDSAPEGGWPVLFINDAQNKFECWLAHQGVSWRIGYTASALIAAGDVPPFVIVGIDNPGPMRSLNYLPYAPGSGEGGFRGDAARWPGGGVEQYMQRVIYEIMPMVTEKFNLSVDPTRVAFGGGSFGGINALYVAMHYPHIFGTVLAESPSLWIAEARFLEDLWRHQGMLPERIFMGCGTREYSATRDHDRDDVDALLLHYYNEAARALESKGLTGTNGRLRYLVEEGAGHHELAWQWRLTGALQYLLGPWRG